MAALLRLPDTTYSRTPIIGGPSKLVWIMFTCVVTKRWTNYTVSCFNNTSKDFYTGQLLHWPLRADAGERLSVTVGLPSDRHPIDRAAVYTGAIIAPVRFQR